MVLFGAMGFLRQKPPISRRTNRQNRSNLSVVRILEVMSNEESKVF